MDRHRLLRLVTLGMVDVECDNVDTVHVGSSHIVCSDVGDRLGFRAQVG